MTRITEEKSFAFKNICVISVPKTQSEILWAIRHCFNCVLYTFDFSTSNPILIRAYPRKRGWPDLPHCNSNLSNSHSPSHLIQGIFLLQTNTLALLLHLRLPFLFWSSSFLLSFTSNSNAFIKHANHPSSTHACTISLHSPLPSEPLFPSILNLRCVNYIFYETVM